MEPNRLSRKCFKMSGNIQIYRVLKICAFRICASFNFDFEKHGSIKETKISFFFNKYSNADLNTVHIKHGMIGHKTHNDVHPMSF